jgi:ATP-binding cassette subfamily F protein 3
MSLISLSRISYSLGTRNLFTDLSFAINPGERTALVGLNGSGKSTLLKLLAGEVEADGGVIARRTGAVIEYVPQVLPDALRGISLFDALAQKLAPALRFAGFEHLIEQRLSAAGFTSRQHLQPLGTLSGGEVNRALLARALVNEPDVVLLDEPTNHMDIEQVALFEHFVNEELTAATVIVSHDRAFLDGVTSRTLFLRDSKIHSFSLPFSQAREALAAHDAAARARRESEDRELERLRESAHRLAEWGRIYSNEKFSYRAKSMQKRINRMESEVTELPANRRASVSLTAAETHSPRIVEVKQLPLVAPCGRTLRVIEHLTVQRGERLAIVGPNGCGKSTFIRTLVAALSGSTGVPGVSFHPSTTIGYYDQDLAHFRVGERLTEAVAARSSIPHQRVTAELVEAGFEYSRHNTLVANLSGGERARLTFLILKLSHPHLLILDEPTNHLDLEGIEQLEETLMSSGGTVIFVSHDRCFLKRVATRVVELSAVSR